MGSSYLFAKGRDLTSPLRPAPYVTCARAQTPFLSAWRPPAAALLQCEGLTLSTTHGAADARGVCASASWRLGVAADGRRGALRGRRTAGGDSRGRTGGQHGCRRAVGAAGGARGAQARVQPLQVSAGQGRGLRRRGPGAAAPPAGQEDSDESPKARSFSARTIII